MDRRRSRRQDVVWSERFQATPQATSPARRPRFPVLLPSVRQPSYRRRTDHPLRNDQGMVLVIATHVWRF